VEDHSSSSETNRLHSLTDEPPAYEPPPEYEAPPNYDEAIKMCKVLMINKDNDLNEGIQSNGKYYVCILFNELRQYDLLNSSSLLNFRF